LDVIRSSSDVWSMLLLRLTIEDSPSSVVIRLAMLAGGGFGSFGLMTAKLGSLMEVPSCTRLKRRL